MHDSTLDLFDDKAEHEAHAYAMMLEAAAAALEVTVDYYIEEFMTDEIWFKSTRVVCTDQFDAVYDKATGEGNHV